MGLLAAIPKANKMEKPVKERPVGASKKLRI